MLPQALPPASQVLVHLFSVPGASLVAQSVKNLPAVQETWVLSLREDGGVSGVSSSCAV